MADIESTIRNVLADVLANGVSAEAIGSDADLVEEYGLDSLQMIAFLLNIEDAFDIELDYESLELDDLRSVRQFATYIGTLNAMAAG